MGIQICACMLLEEPGEIKIDPKIKPFIARTYPRIGLIFSHPKYSEVMVYSKTYQDDLPTLGKNYPGLSRLTGIAKT